MSVYQWKNFEENEDRPEKPRRFGVTEMRGPHYTLLSQNVLQVLFFFFFFKKIKKHYEYENLLLDLETEGQ
jgi:hypothetical protein